jgi:hypothetical protein
MARSAARLLISLARAAAPLVLLLAGVASLVYGVGFHSALVSAEHEIEIDLMPPGIPMHGGMEFPVQPGIEPPGLGPPGDDFGNPWLGGPPPWLEPPQELRTIRDTVIVSEQAAEPYLIREITFGGVRLDAGVLWRTYTGEPPSLCPT